MSSDVAARTLRLLTTLQTAGSWPAPQLAARLGVSTRTLRRDLARLADLGYTVESRPGPGGSYRLVSGRKVPPMTFEDDEVVALVAGLRMAEQAAGGEAAARALVKVRRVLPGRLAELAEQVAAHTEVVTATTQPSVLDDLTAAAGHLRGVRLSYVDRHGTRSRRRLDSLRCLYNAGHWYVLAHDLDREAWRLFRLDRCTDVEAGPPSARRDPPAEDLATWFASDFGRLPH